MLKSRLPGPTPGDSDAITLGEAQEYAWLANSGDAAAVGPGPHIENPWVRENSKEVRGARGMLLQREELVEQTDVSEVGKVVQTVLF